MTISPLAYDDTGAGPPVVLIHGLGASANVWGAQRSALSRHFRVLVPDLPGCGRSPLVDVISVASLVDAVLALLDHARIESAHFAGHSLGSAIVQHLALRYPQRVRSIALVGPIAAPSEAGLKSLRDRAGKARDGGIAAIADATVDAGTSRQTREEHPELAAFVRELVMRQDGEAYARTCEALCALTPAAIEGLTCPALVITGDQDATSPPAAAEAIAGRIGGSRLVVLPDCGHWAPIEQARLVSELLLEHFGGGHAP
jgi:pimeloyl-ACP methyl ester carboxylesterase